jgi:RNA polymerase sigma-70 factor (ECF subfamily)
LSGPGATVLVVPAADEPLHRTGSLPADAVIVARLRQRDEAMFAALLDAWSPGMVRAARAFVADEHAAQDVVQETWLGVLRGIAAFEGRSSLRTWVFRILLNRARTRGGRDARTIPLSSLTPGDDGPTVPPEAFRDAGDPYPGHWRRHPPAWPSSEDRLLAAEVRRELGRALAGLPPRQRIVVTLRDVEGYTSEEVCELLEVSAANQRVLLHRGRAALRAELAAYLAGGAA